jgi:hypothetical protein
MLSNSGNKLNFEIIKHKQIENGDKKMLVKMLKSVNTAIDETGVKSTMRVEGKVYNIFPSLAKKLILAGFAVEHNPIKPQETKNIQKQPETSLLEKAIILIKPGKTNISIANELGITVKELKELKKQMK